MLGNSEFAIMVPPGGEATPNSSNPSHTLLLWKLITKFLGFMNSILSKSNSRIKRHQTNSLKGWGVFSCLLNPLSLLQCTFLFSMRLQLRIHSGGRQRGIAN